MIKLLKKMVGPLVSIFFLLNMTSVGYAETTVSAEVGFIFNTFLFLVYGFLLSLLTKYLCRLSCTLSVLLSHLS